MKDVTAPTITQLTIEPIATSRLPPFENTTIIAMTKVAITPNRTVSSDKQLNHLPMLYSVRATIGFHNRRIASEKIARDEIQVPHAVGVLISRVPRMKLIAAGKRIIVADGLIVCCSMWRRMRHAR